VVAALRADPVPPSTLNIHSLPQVLTRYPAISPTRKILCAAALLLSAIACAPAAAGAEVKSADLAQKGRELILSVRTSEPVGLANLQPHPDPQRSAARYLCLALHRDDATQLLCLGGKKPRKRIGLETLGRGGPETEEMVKARVKRPSPTKLVVAFEPGAAGLRPGRYVWGMAANEGCDPKERCAELWPSHGANAFRLRPVRAVGCTGGTAGLVTHGSRERKLVALTFDDGPSEYTDDFLAVLREKGVHGTFFQIGQEMPGREEVMRQILAEGNELADHTMNHVEFPGYDQIGGAAARIRAYTHFQPCLFRPPGGAVNAGVVATAGSLGMRTVNWDVDPRDWSLPGTGAIYSTIVSQARNGSIVLMHDGGGPRGETLAALPRIIDALRARGFGFATVSELLGERILYRPYG
jgi:peptidoglycan/xylan/chitin deacetylase (PgdA/CDA1 family)